MKKLRFDVVVIGAGAAGMASALAIVHNGFTCVLIDRESAMGGILLQCIHNGFGLHLFKEELTGPEFSARLEKDVRAADIPFYPDTTVLSIGKHTGQTEDRDADTDTGFSLLLSSARTGVIRVDCRALVLAMGSRERNRGNIRIAGDRPAGVYTAGLAQRLINMDGYLPGKRAVIIGSGDIGLIMARRLTLSGTKVEAVVEIQPFPSGLARNIAQCLDDFEIPLFLSHATLRIIGRDRVSGVEIAPIENGAPNTEKARILDCDTVLLSVGLVPENELSARAGVILNPVTNGPVVNSRLMTNIPGIFAAGNVLHIHDLVDRVADEASRAGAFCAAWLSEQDSTKAVCGVPEIPLRAGKNVRYTVPSTLARGAVAHISLRSMIVLDHGEVRLSRMKDGNPDGELLFSRRISWIRPGEMIVLDIPPNVISEKCNNRSTAENGQKTGGDESEMKDSVLEISLVSVSSPSAEARTSTGSGGHAT